MRKGGEQSETNDQSVTNVNSIRPSLSGRLLAMSEPLIARRQIPSTYESARGIDAASHGGDVTWESDRDEMAMWWLEMEWSEGQTS